MSDEEDFSIIDSNIRYEGSDIKAEITVIFKEMHYHSTSSILTSAGFIPDQWTSESRETMMTSDGFHRLTITARKKVYNPPNIIQPNQGFELSSDEILESVRDDLEKRIYESPRHVMKPIHRDADGYDLDRSKYCEECPNCDASFSRKSGDAIQGSDDEWFCSLSCLNEGYE